MASYTPLRAETAADQRLYLEGRLVEVACRACDARVRARKNSEYHTSIQWTAAAVERCEVFAHSAADGGRTVHESCPQLRSSIEQAAKTGVLPMGEPDA